MTTPPGLIAVVAACALLSTACSAADPGPEDLGLPLRVGQSTKVSAEDGSAELTVTGIRRADHADFDQLDNPDRYADQTGYYVQFTIARVDDSTPSDIASFQVSDGKSYSPD